MVSLLLLSLITTQAKEGSLRAPVAVVVTSQRPGAEALSGKIAQRVHEAFKREGVGDLRDDPAASRELRAAGFSDPRSCQGTRACLRKLAVLLGPKAVVVGVDVAKVGKVLALHLEAVAADSDTSLGAVDASLPFTGWGDNLAATIVVFVRDVKDGLVVKRGAEPGPAEPASDAPVASAPTRQPELVPAAVEVRQSPELAKPVRVTPWVLASGAVIGAGTAVAFGVLSANNRGQFDASLIDLGNGTKGSRLPEAQARALATNANTDLAVAVSAAAVGVGLTALATWLFLKE
jgi:hypothetical protein